ncbi:hypothetical protein EV421DRAFT_1909503 [Armillaria borealis]|uniref:Metallo-beta-lactamase domain-containing protein n=1 Tax=Armillaria borealis TaxID=47425 RepID=A0AA39MHN4_9AGAR|nr:hypothetical protein EV421DRAFT_1909503 [Armillaria borealis]
MDVLNMFTGNFKSGSFEDTYVECCGCIDAHQGDIVTLVSSLRRARGYCSPVIRPKDYVIVVNPFGHAFSLVDLPFVASLWRGSRVVFEPVFSDRCSPSQFLGPKKYTEPPCKVEYITEVNAVVISHNDYDCLDNHTLSTLFKQTRPPRISAPLGTEKHSEWIGTLSEYPHILDWGDALHVEIPGTIFKVTCTSTQHFTGRGIHRGAYKDIRVEKAVAIHWGTWILTMEEVTEKLAEECKNISINDGDFLVSDIGERKYF